MPSLRSAWLWVDLGPHMDISADIANADVVIVTVPVPVAGTVKECWLCADILPTTATFVLAKAVGTTDSTVVASVALQTALTANIGASQTVSTSSAIVKVAAGDMLRATWTFTTIGSGEGFGCLVAIEPDIW